MTFMLWAAKKRKFSSLYTVLTLNRRVLQHRDVLYQFAKSANFTTLKSLKFYTCNSWNKS